MTTSNVTIPNLPVAPLVNDNRYASDVEITFRQQLIQALQYIYSGNGLSPPQLTSTEITDLAARQVNGVYVVAKGVIVYNVDTDQLICIKYVAGVPTPTVIV